MKKFVWLFVCFAALPVLAYQVGSVSRPNFSPVEKTDTEQKDASAVPGQQGVQTRSFTSYGSRQKTTWRQGVQTQPVQTQTALEKATKDNGEKAAQDTAKTLKALQKPTPAAEAGKADKKDNKPAQPQASDKNPPAAQGQAPAAGADPAAMMQQLMGGMGGAAAGGNAAGGMPDMSALMGAMGGAQGGAQGGGMPDMSSLMNMMGGGAGANTPKK